MAAPIGRRRRLVSVFIALFLLGEIAIPLRYYAAGDGIDERFAWRMFSSRSRDLVQRRCHASLHESVAGEPRVLRLRETLAPQWSEYPYPGRADVAAALLRWRCADPGVERVRYALRCTSGPDDVFEQHRAECTP